jgi:hypothetical protein
VNQLTVINDWEQYAIPQKRLRTGCIATGYEMILRASKIQGIDFDSFQDEFDLDKELQAGVSPRNNFDSVAMSIYQKYPNIIFTCRSFAAGQGCQKLQFLEDYFKENNIILVSIAQEPFGNIGWHIMPLVNIIDDKLIFLKVMLMNGHKEMFELKKNQLIEIHNNYEGGKEVAYLR